MATRLETMTVPSLDKLFPHFVHTAYDTFGAMESEFGFGGLVKQFMGGIDYPGTIFHEEELNQHILKHIQNSHAWEQLVILYDFAIDGRTDDEDTSYIPTNAADILSLSSFANAPHHKAWERLVWQADGRHGLDSGYPMNFDKLAFLANVDVRTVRNAISAGHLVTVKQCGTDHVQNESARKWLAGRKGFKPTVYAGKTQAALAGVTMPTVFGAILKGQRESILADGGMLATQHPTLTDSVINTLESGVFDLPLSMVNPVADYYQVDRKQFLGSVMRIFFPEQLVAIQEMSKTL